jgi:hypothetical protein
MDKHRSHSENQTLRERLQQEALESRPAFSESLHRQILSAIKREEVDPANLPSIALHRRRPWFVMAAAFATACTLMGAMFHWQNAERYFQPVTTPPNPIVATNNVPDPVPSIDLWSNLLSFDNSSNEAATSFDDLLVFRAITPQSAALQHDLRLAAVVLVERLPVDVEWLAGP